MEMKKLDLGLGEYEELFMTGEERLENRLPKVQDIPLLEIDDFPGHPFQVRLDMDMKELVQSVKERGIITPVILRKKEDGRYETISGHRRRRACELAGLDRIKAEVRELSRDEAVIVMVESNLQRSTIFPSEKAFAYKMRLEAMKRQGKREDLTSAPLAQKLKGKTARERLGEMVGESQDQIGRYIRLTNLVPGLLEKVDEGKIALRPAVEISYLTEQEQKSLLDAIEREDRTPSYAQAIKLRKFSQEGNLRDEVILSIMQEEKGNQKESYKIPRERISKFFPAGNSPQKVEETIVKALEQLRKRERARER